VALGSWRNSGSGKNTLKMNVSKRHKKALVREPSCVFQSGLDGTVGRSVGVRTVLVLFVYRAPFIFKNERRALRRSRGAPVKYPKANTLVYSSKVRLLVIAIELPPLELNE
jgi:hypothetical protein